MLDMCKVCFFLFVLFVFCFILVLIKICQILFNNFKEFEYDYTSGLPKDFQLLTHIHCIQTAFAFKLKGQKAGCTQGYIKIDTYNLLTPDGYLKRQKMMRFFDERGKEIDPENITHYFPLKISWSDYYRNKFQSV